MFKFLHAADLHIDSPLRGLSVYQDAPVGAIRGATRRAVENLVAVALDERVQFVVIAGDVYDGAWKDFGAGLFFGGQVARLAEAGIPVVLLAGNHDAASVIPRDLRLPDSVHRLPTEAPGTVRLDEWGVAVHGQGFADRAVYEDLSLKYPAPEPDRFNLGLLHTSAGGDAAHERYAPCDVSKLAAAGYDYWALGHVHARRDLHAGGGVPVVFPGNTQGRHARETGPKGCEIVTVGDDGGLTRTFRPLDVVRWADVTLDAADLADAAHAGGGADPKSAAVLDDLLDAAAAALREHRDAADGRLLAARVAVTGATPADAALRRDADRFAHEVRAAANALGGVWVEKVQVRTAPPAAAPDWHDDGPLSVLREVLDEAVSGGLEDDAPLRTHADVLAPLRKRLDQHLPPTTARTCPTRSASGRCCGTRNASSSPGWAAGCRSGCA